MEKEQNAIDNEEVVKEPTEQLEIVNEVNEEGSLESADPSIDYQKQIVELKDQLIRTVAESENIRKRAEKQAEETAKYALTSFAKDLISVMENLSRTSENITKEEIQTDPLLKTLSEGVEMTKRELINVFERNGIKRIQPIIGDEFDHNIHQAVAQIEDSKAKPGTIVQIMQAGYLLRDRLLTPAIVGVAKE
jgi:molecular chaperone GrpE